MKACLVFILLVAGGPARSACDPECGRNRNPEPTLERLGNFALTGELVFTAGAASCEDWARRLLRDVPVPVAPGVWVVSRAGLELGRSFHERAICRIKKSF